MPVILTTAEEWEVWLKGPVAEALKLRSLLPNGALQIVAKGQKKDDAP